MSWKVEVTTAGDNGKYTSNGLRFATPDEARRYANDLHRRWTAVLNYRVIECGDHVNYEFKDGCAYALSTSG